MHLPAFSLNPLVRHSVEHPADALERHRNEPGTAHLLIAGDIPILRAGEPGTALLDAAGLSRAGELFEDVFLGTLEGRPVVATLASPSAADLYRDDPGFTVTDLRSVAVRGLVPPEELGLLATAKSVLDWHRRHRFCAVCGTRTVPAQSGFRRDCGSCGAQHFPRTDPVVIMLVARGEFCLLGRQSRFLPGMYSCLAGFLEPAETIEDAVRRETFEEAGVRVGAVRYHSSQPWPFPSSLMIGCIAEATSEELNVDREELEDARWFSRDEVKLMLAGRHPAGLSAPQPIAIAHHLLRAWCYAESP
ncbi:NAD(+) diphosphatase [Microvirga massiliensis]|uniref:NAD(+) diphosphatase n=1 Tax=Microvirga massiliensis TaxID=1033741 RepID=UPI00062BCF4F|nr:NAD(+) diphosphatase [Microvirga massiliensis]